MNEEIALSVCNMIVVTGLEGPQRRLLMPAPLPPVWIDVPMDVPNTQHDLYRFLTDVVTGELTAIIDKKMNAIRDATLLEHEIVSFVRGTISEIE